MSIIRGLLGATCLCFCLPVHAADYSPETICAAKTAFEGVIAQDVREPYLKALFQSHPLVVDITRLGKGGNFLQSPAAMAKYLFDCQMTESVACKSAFKIHTEIVATLQSSEQSSEDYIVKPNLARSGQFNEAALANFLTAKSDGGTYAMTCSKRFEPSANTSNTETLAKTDVEQTSYRNKFDLVTEIQGLEVGQNVDQIGKPIKEKSGATLSVDLNRGEKIPVTIDATKEATGDNVRFVKNETVAAQIAIAMPTDLKFIPLADDWGFKQKVSFFTALDYKSNINPGDELDDWSFGVKYSGETSFITAGNLRQILPGLTLQSEFSRFDADLRYITDLEERDSQQYFGAIKVPAVNLHAAYNHFDALVELTAVLDASDIDEIGDKTALENIKTFGRLGYDLKFSTSVGEFLDYQVDFGATFYYRDSFGKNNADADLWDIGISFAPDDDSNLMLSLMYDRGESLTSLDEQETWKLGFEFKH